MISASLVSELRNRTGAGMMDCKNALVETNGDLDAAIDYLREKGITKATKKASRIAAEGLAKIFIEDNKAIIIEVNSETDFVCQNEEFINMINEIGKVALKSNCATIEELLETTYEDGTVNDLIIAKTFKIGEKLSLRRIDVLKKNDDEVFGSYIHNEGRIAVLVLLKGNNESVAKDIAMQAAAMRPEFLSIDEIPIDRIEKERTVFKEQSINEGKSPEIAEKMVEGRLNKLYKEICLLKQIFIKDDTMDIEKYASNNNCVVEKMIRYEVGEGMEKRECNFAEDVMSQIK